MARGKIKQGCTVFKGAGRRATTTGGNAFTERQKAGFTRFWRGRRSQVNLPGSIRLSMKRWRGFEASGDGSLALPSETAVVSTGLSWSWCLPVSRRYPGILMAALGKYPGDALWALMVFWVGVLCFKKFNRSHSFQAGYFVLRRNWASSTQPRGSTVARDSDNRHLIFGSTFSWGNLIGLIRLAFGHWYWQSVPCWGSVLTIRIRVLKRFRTG